MYAIGMLSQTIYEEMQAFYMTLLAKDELTEYLFKVEAEATEMEFRLIECRIAMKELLKQINEYKKVNPNIRTYLGASKGKKEFYEKFGFVARPNEELGAGMILNNK